MTKSSPKWTNPAESLSSNTARLSIGNQDGDKIRQHVADLIGPHTRRDSAVSITSLDDDKDKTDKGGDKEDDAVKRPAEKVKRRRSSAQKTVQPPSKIHKRKMKMQIEQLKLEFLDEEPVQSLSMTHLKKFLINALSKDFAKAPQFHITAPSKLKKIVLIFVPGLYKSDFSAEPPKNDTVPTRQQLIPSDESKLPFFYNHFECFIPTTMSGKNEAILSPIPGLLMLPLTKNAKRKRADAMSAKKLVLPDLVLSQTQLERCDYPIHSQMDSTAENALLPGWKETRDFEHDGSHTFAIDCEFCKAGSGVVLTRISIVNFQDEVVYDSYVKPAEEITDYVTKYSGITEELLQGVTTTLADVQEKVLSLISSSDILIGHSLNSDLNVLQIRHPKIIDTAVLFEHYRGHTYRHALKWLAETYLGRAIQKGEANGSGHSSIEDSKACLDLVKMKLMEGPDYGRIVCDSFYKNVCEQKPEVSSVIIDYSTEEYEKYLEGTTEQQVSAKVVSNDEEAVSVAIDEMHNNQFSLMWLRELEFNCGTTAVPPTFSGGLLKAENSGKNKEAVSEDDRNRLLQKTNAQIERIYREMPNDSLLIVSTDGGDCSRINQLQKVRRDFQRYTRDGNDVSKLDAPDVWDFDKVSELQKATEEARQGLTFVTLKTEKS